MPHNAARRRVVRSVVQDSARCWAVKDGARRRVMRGERWRTAPGGESMHSTNTRLVVSLILRDYLVTRDKGQRKAPGGERWRAVPGGERLDSARRRAASGWTAQGAGLRERDSTRRQAV
eukprot:5392575-Pleurochrysis_carterae.AAC.2